MERILLIAIVSLVSLGAAGIGTWALVPSLIAAARGIASKSWLTVEGIINTNRIDEWQDSDSGGSSLGIIKYKFGIEYSYEIAGVKHTSRQIAVGESWPTFGSKGKTEEKQAKYLIGAKVKVYYDPKRPELSTLEAGFKPKTIIWLVLGIINIGWGIFVFFFLVLPEIFRH